MCTRISLQISNIQNTISGTYTKAQFLSSQRHTLPSKLMLRNNQNEDIHSNIHAKNV